MNKKLSTKRKYLAIVIALLITGEIVGLSTQGHSKEIEVGTEVFAESNFKSSAAPILSESAVIVNNQQMIAQKAEAASVDQVKVAKVSSYLTAYGAPLAPYSEYLVKTADDFGIDYRLVAAISIVESGGGKNTYRPYNAWGWGGANGYSFSSYEESIYTVTKGLAEGYYARGATTPRQIAPAYNPHTPEHWSAKVEYVMSQM